MAKKKKPQATRNQRSRAVSPAFKAAIHHAAGAGKKRVTRKFFGLTDAELDKLAAFAGVRLQANLDKLH